MISHAFSEFFPATAFKKSLSPYLETWPSSTGPAASEYVAICGCGVDRPMFSLDEGFNILAMTIVGGSGTLLGPIVGSVFVLFLTEALRSASRYRLVFYAILIIGTMWINPAGIAGAKNSSAAQYSLHIFQRKGVNRDAGSNS